MGKGHLHCFQRYKKELKKINMTDEQWDRIPAVYYEGDNVNAYDLWMELTEALEKNVQEFPRVPRYLLEIKHIIHFFGGASHPLLKNFPDEEYPGWWIFKVAYLQ
jgi:hypothetical protein